MLKASKARKMSQEAEKQLTVDRLTNTATNIQLVEKRIREAASRSMYVTEIDVQSDFDKPFDMDTVMNNLFDAGYNVKCYNSEPDSLIPEVMYVYWNTGSDDEKKEYESTYWADRLVEDKYQSEYDQFQRLY